MLPVVVVVCALTLQSESPAGADPLPGYDLDPVVFEQRIHDCLAGVVDDKFLIMGWINLTSGAQHRWYCSSVKHMYFRASVGSVHDPLVDPQGFMTCVDRTVSYGFPRRGEPGNTVLNYQYMGTSRIARVVINDATGDVATAYTDPPDDWSTCAGWSP